MSSLKKAHRLLGLTGLLFVSAALVVSFRQAPNEPFDGSAAPSVNSANITTSGSEDTLTGQNQFQAVVDEWTASLSAPSSVLLVDSVNGQVLAEHRPDDIVTSASLYKLFIAYLTYQDIERGIISYQSSITIEEEPEDANQEPVRRSASIDECLRLTIVTSDNPCGEALGKRIGWREVDNRLEQAGFQDTKLNNFPSEDGEETYQKTTARDVSRLLFQLNTGELLDETSTENLIELLKAQQINDRIPAISSAAFAHKTANLDYVFHDAGIFTHVSGRSIVYSVLSYDWQGSFFPEAQQAFQSLLSDLVGVLN